MADYPADKIFAPCEAVKAIADSGKTPFYLYHKQGIEDSIRELHCAFSWNPGYQNYYPLRENINPHLLRILCSAGTGVSVTTKTELEHACSCGFSGSALLYEPSYRDPEAERIALDQNAVWLFNSEALFPEILPDRILLRYNPCDLPLPPQIKQAAVKSQNGLNHNQLIDQVLTLRKKGVSQIGLALSIGSYSIHPGFWRKKAAMLFRFIPELMEKTGIKVWCCYIGEGPGLPYRPRVSAPNLAEEVEQLQKEYEALPEALRPTLYTAVTSRLMEAHGILVTKVLEQRFIYKTFLVFDAGISQYSRPIIKRAYRHVSVLGRHQIEDRKLYSLVGNLPNSFDRLVENGRMLPKVSPGDYCVIHDVGCGGRSMPMLYGLRPLAAEYLYEPDGTIRQISKGRTEKEVLDFLTA